MTPDQYGLEPSWMPLILVLVMAVAAALLFLSLRRHVKRVPPDPIDEAADDETSGAEPAGTDTPVSPGSGDRDRR